MENNVLPDGVSLRIKRDGIHIYQDFGSRYEDQDIVFTLEEARGLRKALDVVILALEEGRITWTEPKPKAEPIPQVAGTQISKGIWVSSWARNLEVFGVSYTQDPDGTHRPMEAK